MKLRKWIKIMVATAGILSLAACTHTKKPDDSAINDANSAYAGDMNDSGESSGLGEGSSFGDAGDSRHASNGRIYYFDYDSNSVHSSDMPAIRSNASYLSGHPNAKVLLEGHTDPRGSREYNIGLGERRAKAVADILTSNGASRAQVRVVSYGAQKLATPGHSESDYQQDRRVVLVYLKR